MDGPSSSVPFWDAVRAWADSAGILLPQEPGEEGGAARPHVPQSVCDNCPICQGAATLEQVNPQVVDELTQLARGIVDGIGSALASAAQQRRSSGGPPVEGATQADDEHDRPQAADGSGEQGTSGDDEKPAGGGPAS